MAKFHYRLETLLKIRGATRNERRAELAQAYDADRMLQQQLEQVLIEMDGVNQKVRTASQPGTVHADQLLCAQRYRLQLSAQRQQFDQQRQQIGEEIERRREALVEADREVRTLEKLRERHKAKHDQQQARREVKEMDENTLLRSGHRSD